MCLEDLRLGRGRINRSTVQIPTGPTVTIAPDPTRVLVMVTLAGQSAQGDSIDIFVGPNISSPQHFTLIAVQTLFLLKIEELGQLITGPLTFSLNNVSATAVASLTEVYTEVNAPPMDTYKP